MLFFDLGWTIEDETLSQIDRAEKAVKCCSEFGIKVSVERIIELQDEGGAQGVANVFKYALSCIGLSADQILTVTEKAAWDPAKLTLYHDARTVLYELSHKHDLGIIANQSKPVDDRLRQYGIYHLFKVVISSCDVGLEKPEHGIFRLALEKAGLPNDNVWMIGDRIDNDIIPAKELGWGTIRIRNGSHRMREPSDDRQTADYTIRNIRELLGIFA